MRTRIALAISMFTVALATLTTIPTASSGAPATPRHHDAVTAVVAQPQQHPAPQIMLSAEPTTTTSTTTTTAPPVTTTTVTQAPAPVVASPAPAPTDDVHAIFECIIRHESGGDPAAVNSSSGAGGLFQFLPSSWLAYGGGQFAALPNLATADQQWQIALAAQAQSYWYPWVGTGCTPVG